MSAQIIDIKLDDFIGESQCQKARSGGKYVWGTSGLLIGRDVTKCDLPVDCEYVSREHARVSYLGSDFFIEDRGSTDGTKLNGTALEEKRKYSLLDKDGSKNWRSHYTRANSKF